MPACGLLTRRIVVPAAEVARKTPLFPGDSELQQLLHIFKCARER